MIPKDKSLKILKYIERELGKKTKALVILVSDKEGLIEGARLNISTLDAAELCTHYAICVRDNKVLKKPHEN